MRWSQCANRLASKMQQDADADAVCSCDSDKLSMSSLVVTFVFILLCLFTQLIIRPVVVIRYCSRSYVVV